MKKLFVLVAAPIFALVTACSSCTPAQNAQVVAAEGAVFTAEQAGCLAINSGMFGTATAVTDLEQACNIAKALEPAVIAATGSFAKAKLAKQAK